jgi:hypothetical protein
MVQIILFAMIMIKFLFFYYFPYSPLIGYGFICMYNVLIFVNRMYMYSTITILI